MGIEPTFLAWEANVLPLNYTRDSRHFKSAEDQITLDDGVAEPASCGSHEAAKEASD